MKVQKDLLLDFIPQQLFTTTQKLYICNKKQIFEFNGTQFNEIFSVRNQGQIQQIFVQYDIISANISNQQIIEFRKVKETNKLVDDKIINLKNVVSYYKEENISLSLCNNDETEFYNIYLGQKSLKDNLKIMGKQPKIVDVKQNRLSIQETIYSIIIQSDHQIILLNAIYNNDDGIISCEQPIEKNVNEEILITQLNNIQFSVNDQSDLSCIQNCNSILFQGDAEYLKMQALMLNYAKSESAQVYVNIITENTIKQLYLSNADTEKIDETMSLIKIIEILKEQVLNDKYVKNQNQCLTIQGLDNSFVQQQFLGQQDSLEQIVIAAYLFNNSIYQLFKKAVKLIELQITQQQETHIISNVRNIAKQCRDTIKMATQILLQTINNQQQYIQQDSDIKICKILISVVQNSGEILQLLSENQQTFEQESLQYILESKIYICVSKILSVMQKEKTNCDQQFQEKLQKTMTFNNIQQQQNPLYSQSFGYFQVDKINQLQVIPIQDSQIAQKYQQIDQIENSAIYQLYQVIQQLDFVQYQQQDIKLIDFITLLSMFLQQQQQQPDSLQSLARQNEKQKLIFDVLRIIFLYNQFCQGRNSEEVYQISTSLSVDQNEARKFYFAAQLIYKIDCGECYKKQNYTTEEFFQQNYFDKDAQILMLKQIGQKIINDNNILFNNIAQQQEFEQILIALQDSIDTIKFTPDFIVRLTHLAAIKGKYDLALGLAQYCFCKEGEYIELEEYQQYQNNDKDLTKYYPYHPCLSAYENTIRILLLKSYKDFDVQAGMQAVNCLNSFMSHKCPYQIINQRIAILQNQIFLGQITFEEEYDLLQNKQRNIREIIQMLMLHKQPTQEQKRLIIKYTLQNNNIQLSFVLAFLYQYDELLALKFIKYLTTNKIELLQKQKDTINYIYSQIQQHYNFLDIQGIEDNFEQLLQFKWLDENIKVKVMNPLAMSLCHTVANEDQSQQLIIQEAMKILDESGINTQNQDAIYKEIVQSTIGFQQQPQEIKQQFENIYSEQQVQKPQQKPQFRQTRAILLREQFNKNKLLKIKQEEEREARLNNNYQFRQQNQRYNSFNNLQNNPYQQQQQPIRNNTYQNNMYQNNNYKQNTFNTVYQQPTAQYPMTNNKFSPTYDNNLQANAYNPYNNQAVSNPFAHSTQQTKQDQYQFGQQNKVTFQQIQQEQQQIKQERKPFVTKPTLQFGNTPTNKYQQVKVEQIQQQSHSVIKNEISPKQDAFQFDIPQKQQNPFNYSNQQLGNRQVSFDQNNNMNQFQTQQNNQFNPVYNPMQQQQKVGGLRKQNTQLSPQITNTVQKEKSVSFNVIF